MRDTAILPPRFDPVDSAVVDDPYPTYARLRAFGALCRGGPGEWVVTRHAEVFALMRDERLGVEFPEPYHRFGVGDGPTLSFRQRILLTRDPPGHQRLRHLMRSFFLPAQVRARVAAVSALVERRLEPLLAAGGMEAVTDLAAPLAADALCDLIGIPAEDRDDLRPQALQLGRAFLPVIPPDDRPAVDGAVQWLRDYTAALVAERTRRPQHDLVSHMLAGQADDPTVTTEEIVDNIFFLAFSGFETTVNAIASSFHLLAEHPEQYAKLRVDPRLVDSAVDEVLRFDAPIQATGRLVHQPVTIEGRTIRAGRTLLLLLGSANRDERCFSDPDRFDVTRDPIPHVSFGGGIHHCLGAHLARLECAETLHHILARVDEIGLAAVPQRDPRPLFRAYASVPVSFG